MCLDDEKILERGGTEEDIKAYAAQTAHYEPERSCYSCEHYIICGARQDVDSAIKKIKLNIDGDAAPKKMEDVFNTFGQACLNFKELCQNKNLE